jgi:hypothetical protein
MAGSGQRAHGQSSGGMNIDDHSAFMGSQSKQTILPMGVHFKEESSAEGAGSMTKYEDTSASIKSQQEMGIKKIKGHPMKSGYRE